MYEKKNLVDLGNFGFLLRNDRPQDKEIKMFLYELACLAEGNVYTNARMSGVYVRQLAEAFLGYIVDVYNLRHIDANLNNEGSDGLSKYIWILYNQAIEIHEQTGNAVRPPKGYPRTTDIVPWNLAEYNNTVNVSPEIKDYLVNYHNKKIQEDSKKGTNKVNIDCLENSYRYYAWHYVRHLGNSASHTKQSDVVKYWLKSENIIKAIEFLRDKLHLFFVSSYDKKVKLPKYTRLAMGVNSRQIFYPQTSFTEKKVPQIDEIPAYTERLYNGVVPMENKYNSSWNYKNNKYYLLRKYDISDADNSTGFLMHSQEAYLKLQENAVVRCVAPYTVLADTQHNSGYYISMYEFPALPLDFNFENLQKLGAYKSFENILRLFLELFSDFENMHNAEIYLRNFTHESLKLCKIGTGHIQNFKVYIINLEMTKLNDSQATMYGVLNIGNVKNFNVQGSQYSQIIWKPDMNKVEYIKFDAKRLGEVFANVLCPSHLSSEKFDKIASRTDILSENNPIINEPVMANRERIEKLMDIISNLRNGNFLMHRHIRESMEKLLLEVLAEKYGMNFEEKCNE